MKPPSLRIAAAWLTEAWTIVKPSTIQVSFTCCALGRDEELHLSRRERLGVSFMRESRNQDGEQTIALSVQEILDEFDDLVVVDDQ